LFCVSPLLVKIVIEVGLIIFPILCHSLIWLNLAKSFSMQSMISHSKWFIDWGIKMTTSRGSFKNFVYRRIMSGFSLVYSGGSGGSCGFIDKFTFERCNMIELVFYPLPCCFLIFWYFFGFSNLNIYLFCSLILHNHAM